MIPDWRGTEIIDHLLLLMFSYAKYLRHAPHPERSSPATSASDSANGVYTAVSASGTPLIPSLFAWASHDGVFTGLAFWFPIIIRIAIQRSGVFPPPHLHDKTASWVHEFTRGKDFCDI